MAKGRPGSGVSEDFGLDGALESTKGAMKLLVETFNINDVDVRAAAAACSSFVVAYWIEQGRSDTEFEILLAALRRSFRDIKENGPR